MQIDTYLFFDGNCEEAFTFYAELFGGRIEGLMKHSGTPAAGEVPPEWLEKVLHARLVIDGHVLMASDAPPGRQQTPQGFSVSVGMPDVAEAERVFAALAEGGKVIMPIDKTFWAERFGMLVDRFGIPWMVSC